MASLFPSGLWIEIQPDDVAGLGDVAPGHLQNFLSDGAAHVHFFMDIFRRDARQQTRTCLFQFQHGFQFVSGPMKVDVKVSVEPTTLRRNVCTLASLNAKR